MLALIHPISHEDLLKKLSSFEGRNSEGDCFDGLNQDDRDLILSYRSLIKDDDPEDIWTDEVSVQAFKELTDTAGARKFSAQPVLLHCAMKYDNIHLVG